MTVDFSKIIGRSRKIADELKNGIGFLFSKNNVKHEIASGQLHGAHKVRIVGKDGNKDVTAEHVIIAVGARADAASVRSVRREVHHRLARGDDSSGTAQEDRDHWRRRHRMRIRGLL